MAVGAGRLLPAAFLVAAALLPHAVPQGVGLPSGAGPSLSDALRVAWGVANASANASAPAPRLLMVVGYEALAGVEPSGAVGPGRAAVAEPLDGRLQAAGAWELLFASGTGSAQRLVIVWPDGHWTDGDPTVLRLAGGPGIPPGTQFDSVAAALACRRAGGDDFLSEAASPYLQYGTLATSNATGQVAWSLLIRFGSTAPPRRAGEVAACQVAGPGAARFTWGERPSQG